MASPCVKLCLVLNESRFYIVSPINLGNMCERMGHQEKKSPSMEELGHPVHSRTDS